MSEEPQNFDELINKYPFGKNGLKPLLLEFEEQTRALLQRNIIKLERLRTRISSKTQPIDYIVLIEKIELIRDLAGSLIK